MVGGAEGGGGGGNGERQGCREAYHEGGGGLEQRKPTEQRQLDVVCDATVGAGGGGRTVPGDDCHHVAGQGPRRGGSMARGYVALGGRWWSIRRAVAARPRKLRSHW